MLRLAEVFLLYILGYINVDGEVKNLIDWSNNLPLAMLQLHVTCSEIGHRMTIQTRETYDGKKNNESAQYMREKEGKKELCSD